jgi:hypothetical protein
MAMFDWYEPSGHLRCPECGTVLPEWQGTDGPCVLYVWKEGETKAADQRVDEDAKADPSVRAAERLPASFEIHSYDCGLHVVTAVCACVGETWDTTVITGVDPQYVP